MTTDWWEERFIGGSRSKAWFLEALAEMVGEELPIQDVPDFGEWLISESLVWQDACGDIVVDIPTEQAWRSAVDSFKKVTSKEIQ